PMTPHERDQLGMEFPDMLPAQVAVGIIANDDFGYFERRRGRTDFERPGPSERLVFSGVDRPAAFAMGRRQHDDAKPFGGQPRQRTAARQRLVVGMRKDR